jgi:hypothetical protein
VTEAKPDAASSDEDPSYATERYADSDPAPTTRTVSFLARLTAIDQIGNIAAANAPSSTNPTTNPTYDACIVQLNGLLNCPNLLDYEEPLFLIHVVNAIGQCGPGARVLIPNIVVTVDVDPALQPVVTQAAANLLASPPASTNQQKNQQANQQNPQTATPQQVVPAPAAAAAVAVPGAAAAASAGGGSYAPVATPSQGTNPPMNPPANPPANHPGNPPANPPASPPASHPGNPPASPPATPGQ